MRKYTNAGSTTLDGTINNSSDPVTFTVTSSSGFPASGEFSVLIDNEILLVTSVSGTSFTAKRAQEGTSIASHADDTEVHQTLSALALKEIIKLECFRPYPKFDLGTYDDEFDDENFSGWTKVPDTSVTIVETEKNDCLSLAHSGGGGASQFTAYMKAASISVGDYIEIAFRTMGRHANYPICGLFFSDGTTYGSGNQTVLYGSVIESGCLCGAMTGYNTIVDWNFVNYHNHNLNSHLFLRLYKNASNVYDGFVSADGISWAALVSKANNNLASPTHIGFGVTTWGASFPQTFSIDYFKKGS